MAVNKYLAFQRKVIWLMPQFNCTGTPLLGKRWQLTSELPVQGFHPLCDAVRYTHKAWLLEEFQDCCRWDVDKDFVEQTVPHKLIHEIFQPMYDEGDDDEDGDDGEEEAFRETGKFTF